MPAEEKLTPMMQQYFEVKRGLPANTLLLFRLGDFYEMFYEDAEAGSKIMGITLTRRSDYPMAGIPHHAAENYVGKLLAAGKKVAICEQLEPARPGKLVKRSLTRILSPGTTLESTQLETARNLYLCALALDKKGLHASWLDLSTGEFKLASDPRPEDLLPLLTALNPAEIIVPEGEREIWQRAPHSRSAVHDLERFCTERLVSELPAYQFESVAGAESVRSALGVLNLQGFGIAEDHPALGAAGAVVAYATENLCARPENLRRLQEYRSNRSLLLDPATLRNLEVFESVRGERSGSLRAAIDRTATAAGGRLIERWLAAPVMDRDEIERRLDAVGELLASAARIEALADSLRCVRDVPRILGRLQNRIRNPRELGAIRETLLQLPGLIGRLSDVPGPRIAALRGRVKDSPALRELLERALEDELPGQLSDGGYIRRGYDAELDRLRALTGENRTWLAELEKQEQERTSIRSLKVRFTQAFGYYIEVTKSNLHLVPGHYIRRQTTVNGERYVTEELKQKEKEIFHAEENAASRENDLFSGLVAAVLAEAGPLLETAEALAELDVFIGWAALARDWRYCRPRFEDSGCLEITEGRHPVVEQMMKQERLGLGGNFSFVPNDASLDAAEAQILLITGPNMAGKSTYIRQVALIALMAHIGCWVPAAACRLGPIDRIFSRVGASDDLARGNSTFMVEMNETANILNNATDRSLIILDEVGRGTSTYDGLSIAWAVVEFLHRSQERGPRTLFATHYQELTQLEKFLPRLQNFSVAVKEWGDEIVFVRRVLPGAADRSYGIQVARLAGLPLSVIERAKVILEKLESDDSSVQLPAAPAARPKRKITVKPSDEDQLMLL